MERCYEWSVREFGMRLSSIMSNVIENQKLTYADIAPYIDKIKVFNEGAHTTIQLGFEYFFKKKYCEAIYILTPQLETLFSYLLGKVNVSKYSAKDHDVRCYKGLNEIFWHLREIMEEDVRDYLRHQLIEPGGMNLRNALAHGRICITSDALQLKAIILFQIYIILTVRYL